MISLFELLEPRMLAEFFKQGVGFKLIRATIEIASREFGGDYPLSNRKFLTDGQRIFMQAHVPR